MWLHFSPSSAHTCTSYHPHTLCYACQYTLQSNKKHLNSGSDLIPTAIISRSVFAEHMKFMDSLAHIFIIKNFNYFLVTIPQCVDIKSVCLQIVLCHIVWFLKTLFEWLTWVSHTSQKSLSNIWFWVEIEFSIISIPQQPLATHSSSSSVWVLVKISHSRWHANRYGLVKCVS